MSQKARITWCPAMNNCNELKPTIVRKYIYMYSVHCLLTQKLLRVKSQVCVNVAEQKRQNKLKQNHLRFPTMQTDRKKCNHAGSSFIH